MKFGSLIPWKEKSLTPSAPGDVLDPFAAFRRDIERVFDDFFSGFANGVGGLGALAVAHPSVDVRETDTEVVVTAEVPGLDEKDLEVTLSGDVLTIKGEKKAEHEHRNGGAFYVERRFGAFSRSLRLPFAAGTDEIEAKYDKGLLTVHIPKPAELRQPARRIDVKHV